MTKHHPTACIDPSAQVASDAVIGPYCVIGAHAAIAGGCELVAHVHVAPHTVIGARTRVQPFVSLGGPPQSTKYRGGATRAVIGADCDIRESVTVNRGTEDGGGETRIGDRAMLMASSHVAHDCQLGNNIIMANSSALGGHCILGDHVFIGGLTGLHQFTRVGAHAMIGGMTALRGDVIPFGLALGPERARLRGVNLVGMKRRGFSRESMRAVQKAVRRLFAEDEVLGNSLDAVEAEFGADAAVKLILAFLREARQRPLCRPEPRNRQDWGATSVA